MRDRTFLITVNQMSKDFAVTLLTSFDCLGILHRRL
jgi:hypothetical protein